MNIKKKKLALLDIDNDRYKGIPTSEAKLLKLADVAMATLKKLREDPVYIASRKAKLTPCVSSNFYEDVLDVLNDAMLGVDGIVHGGFELPWVEDAICDALPKQRKKYERLRDVDVK